MTASGTDQRPDARTAPGTAIAEAGLAGLSPAYFGMVMATGIVSLAAQMLGWPGIAISDEYGGLGLGLVELVILAEELGYAVAGVPPEIMGVRPIAAIPKPSLIHILRCPPPHPCRSRWSPRHSKKTTF